jgi:hypothetical protein
MYLVASGGKLRQNREASPLQDEMATIVAMLSVENVYAQPKKKKRDGDREEEDETPARGELMLSLVRDGFIDDRGDQLTYLRLLRPS